MKRYQIAIYLRLSKEDDKNREESNSITMQRILLQKYVAEKFLDYDLMEFCDDGYSGTNFERPGMQKMLEMVKTSKIDCIVVKDFSRFARDYIELGSYLEQIFPFMGIRFISVNDNFDSENYQGSIADIDVNFKGLLYDLYSKDLSRKVRSSLAVRKENGEYVSGSSPFGYEKDAKDRHRLVIAEDEAKVVRRIFSLTMDGYTSVEIARLFNETGVKTPIEFKIEKGKISRAPKGERFLWSNSVICQILRNEIYIGNIVQKKTARDFASGKPHLNPREDWIVSYNHHEPIIEKRVFDKVQEGRGRKKIPQYNPTHPLTGKLICGCCKKKLEYRRGLNPYFRCGARYLNAMDSCVEKVNAMFLEQYILFMLQEKLRDEGGLERLRREEVNRLGREIKELRQERQTLSARILQLKHQNFEAYQRYAMGKKEKFQTDEIRIKSAEKELEELDESIQKMQKEYDKKECERGELCFESQIAVLSKEMIDQYIEKIVVYDEKNIEIYWREKVETV